MTYFPPSSASSSCLAVRYLWLTVPTLPSLPSASYPQARSPFAPSKSKEARDLHPGSEHHNFAWLRDSFTYLSWE